MSRLSKEEPEVVDVLLDIKRILEENQDDIKDIRSLLEVMVEVSNESP